MRPGSASDRLFYLVVGALTLLAFQAFKLLATLFLLALAPRLIGELHWPALLATLAVGLQTYWVALAIRPRGPSAAPTVFPVQRAPTA